MKTKRQLWVSCLATMLIGGGMIGAGITTAQAVEGGESSSEGVEVMTRGPVHEAFAETVVFDPQPGIIVLKQPPVLIEEIPPDQRPAGDNVAWIPGYWAWDDEPDDFLWVSGIWRNLPPGREWVPGYWSTVDTGHQWTSGYWQDAEATEVTYLPEPPRSVERGPSVAASSDEETWIPGNWEYQQDRYAWRAGYWVTARPDWCWTPSYYRWTRYGCVYVDGYWDYPVASRGVVFAPVRFHNSYYERPGYYYTPLAAISLSVFSNHLFLRPNYCHYYYGDYYEPRYRDHYYASFSYGSRYRGYDPIFSHDRWQHRDRDWTRDRQNYYEYRRDNVDARPPRTWAALNGRRDGDRQRDDFGVVDRYDRVVSSRSDDGRRFQTVSRDERDRFVSKGKEVRNFGRERQQRESVESRVKGEKSGRTEVSRMKVSRSPVVSKRSDRAAQNGGPPARLQQRTSDKRSVEKGAIASNDGKNGQASKTGRDDQERAGANAGSADKQRANAVGKNLAEPNRESRTIPGQRRDTAASSKGKPQRTAEASARPDKSSGGRAEMDRKATTSAAPKGQAEPRRDATQTGRSQDQPRVSNDRVPTEKRAANPTVQQRKESPTPKREAAPQAKPKSAQPEMRVQPAREAAPSRKVMAAPGRQPAQQAAPQRTAVRPQEKVQPPQRQQAPRPEPRKTQAAPQRQMAAPVARPEPQRQRAQPAPQRQAVRQEPQRQAARPTPQRETARSAPQRQATRTAPQPERAAPRERTKASRTEATADPRTENKKGRSN